MNGEADIRIWFEIGTDAFEHGAPFDALPPPIGEPEIQRWWLGGFVSAWAESDRDDPGAIPQALRRVCAGRRLLGELLDSDARARIRRYA